MFSFEKLVSRDIVRYVSSELDLAGIKITVNRFFQIAILGGIDILIITSLLLFFLFHVFSLFAVIGGILAAGLFEAVIYAILEFLIDKRKTFMESILADYLQITSANIRSGMSIDKALLSAAKPEFKYFSDDVKLVSEQVYAGETIENSLNMLAGKYRSVQLKHTVRLIIESIYYGGGITDLLNQVSKDIRNQQMIQKEISGQLFMYSIFIAFASIIGAPALYGLTSQMIKVTDTVWQGILQQNPGGLPSEGISFLKPSPPQITIQDYQYFAMISIFIVATFCAFITSAISSGSTIKGIRYAPLFIITAFVVYFIVLTVMNGIFTGISGV
jgi:hypothetical protein